MSTDINTSTSNVSTSASSMTLTKRYGMIALFAVLALFMGAKLTGALVSAPAGNGASMHGMYTYQTTTLGAPTGVGVTGSATGSLTATWTNPGTTGAAITSYTVTDATGNQTLCTQTVVGALGAANSCTWTPTSKYAGTIYVQSNGTGVTSVSDGTGATLAVPSAPTGTPTISYVTAGNMTISYSSVSATLPVTSYGVYTNNVLVCTSTTTSCTINLASNALAAGQNYTFSVVAINAAGNSVASSLSASAIAKNAPGAVTGLSAAYNAAYGTVDVSYTAPASNGGSALTYSYYINGTTLVTCGTASVTTAKCSIALTALPSPFNGAITVIATNGTSANSYADGFTSVASSNAIFVGAVPNVPASNSIAYTNTSSGSYTGFAATGYDLLTATFATPSAGAAVNGFTAQLYTCTSATVSTTTTCTASGSPKFLASTATSTTFNVAPGAIYTVGITATNFAGSGPELKGLNGGSYLSIAASVPAIPVVSLVSATNNSITYSFTAPASNGSAISGYSVQLLASGANSGTASLKAAAGTYTISGLAAGYTYDVAVTAINNVGSGTAGSLSGNTGSVTLGLAPSASAAVITYNATGATISWTPQYIDANGDVASGLTYTVVDGGQVLCTSTTTSCTVTDTQLKAQIARTSSAGLNFYVYSTDTAGVASNPTPSTTIALPNVVSAVTTYSDANAAGNGAVNVAWTAGASSNGTPAAASYTIVLTDSTKGTVTTFTAAGTATSFLIPASAFSATSAAWNVQVIATAATGSAAAVASSNITAGAFAAAGTGSTALSGYASSPTGVTGINDANGNFIIISWTAGSSVTGNPVSKYTATLTAASGNTYTCTSTTTSCEIFGVPTNTSYSATVVANAPLGDSPAATAATIKSTGLSAPATIVSAVSNTAGTSVTVTFTLPSTSPSLISGYMVTLTDGAGNAGRALSGGQMTIFGGLLYPEYYSCGAVLNTISIPAYGYTGSLDPAVFVPGATVNCSVTVPASATPVTYTAKVTLIEAGAGFNPVTQKGVNVVSSATTTVTTKSAPSKMAAPVATVSSATGKVTITFTPPTSANGTVTSYVITATNTTSGSDALAASSCTLPTGTLASQATIDNTANTTTTHTITETIPATGSAVFPVTCQYTGTLEGITYTVTATNGTGTSIASAASTSVTPSAPVMTTVSAAGSTSKGYTLGWTAVTGATSYTVTLTGGASPITYTGITATTYVVPASALASGNSYTVSVAPVNAYGTGAATVATVVTTVATPSFVYYTDSATAPTTVTLLITNGETTKLPITYNVFATISGVPTQIGTNVSSPFTFAYATGEGIANITVYGVTAAGASAGATSSTTVVGAKVPGTPAFVSSSSTSTTATVTWTNATPTATSGSPVNTAATATLTSSTGTVIACPTTPSSTANGSGTCTWTGLTSNTIYTFSVTNTDVAGSSVTPLLGNVVTTTSVPGAPTITAVAASPNGYDAAGYSYEYINITWAAPTNVGGSPITGYLVSVTTGGTPKYCSTVLTATSTTCSISVTNGATYTYSVQAMNAGGLGTAATTLSGSGTDYVAAKSTVVVPAASDVPATPVAFTSVLSGISAINYNSYGSITTYFTPGAANASAVTSFTCYAKSAGYTTVSATVPYVAGQTAPYSCTLTGLSNVAYTVTVVADNPYGDAYATPSTALAVGTTSKWVANAHVNFGGASVVGGTISVQWIAPTPFPGTVNATAVTGYTATATDAAGNTFTCTGAATDTLCTIKGLANNTTYSVTVVATFAAGASTSYETVAIKTLAGSAPSAPAVTGVVSTATGLSVTWTAPTTVGSGQLVGYWVVATDSLTLQQSTCPYNATYGVILAPAVTCTINGLVHDDAYTISVTAITLDGAGNKQLSAAGTKAAVFTAVAPEPVIATFSAVTAKQKSVSALSANAKSALNNLISVMNDGANVTVTGYGTTKGIALARANAAASYLFNNGAAVHVTVKTVISKTVKTALVTVTKN